MKRLRAPAAVETVLWRSVNNNNVLRHFLLDSARTDEFCAIADAYHVGSVKDVEPDEKGDDQDADGVEQELRDAIEAVGEGE